MRINSHCVSTKAALVGVLSAAVLAAGAIPASAYTNTELKTRKVSVGNLRVGFKDTWKGTGMKTWTLDKSSAAAEWVQKASRPHLAYTIKLTDGICFNKYGIGSVSVSGSGLSPGGVGGEDDCGAGVYQGDKNKSVKADHGKVIGRGNAYGRWIWVSHSATASMKYGSTYYDVNAYHRSSPVGGSV
ncbi:hypothetical protein [Streptomyces sp. ITFR-6]|uniref:hypothetical protein n=1 Tax=Streptomyces sp. ITFR-6 TaxID=3075197 RepID=UPI00288BC476|nr:hypothetical protein [Streptomyces sp. ITFR-6]WNI30413.1 hypothetical protein RLT59_17635 [Streptomyces sp. ITFR-6]